MDELKNFSAGAFVIILDEEEKVLLGHRRDFDAWNLPGGGVEKGESPWEAGVRETKEETGLDVEIERVLSVTFETEHLDIVFTFLGKVVGGELMENEEADELKWFGKDELPNTTLPNQKKRLERFLGNMGEEIWVEEILGKKVKDLIKEGKWPPKK